MNNLIIINGRFLSRSMTGVDRFASEIVRELDKVMSKRCVLALPRNARLPEGGKVGEKSWSSRLELKNIEIRRVGFLTGNLWEQIELPLYAKWRGGTLLNLCNSVPLLKPDVVCIHDMQIHEIADCFKPNFVRWYKLMFAFATRFAKKILTVSEFSRSEILKHYPYAAKIGIEVIPNAWQHIERVMPDEGVLQRFGLKPKGYYYSISGVSRNKNLAWIVRAAKAHPEEVFVVSGNLRGGSFAKNTALHLPENIIQTGYANDAEIKALMMNAKAYICPSYYEGFGIPPLEAMAVGCPVIVSGRSSLPEVCGDSAAYIDPDDPTGTIPPFSNSSSNSNSSLQLSHQLSRYSWHLSAKKLTQTLSTQILEI